MAPYTHIKPFQCSQILGAVDADKPFKKTSKQLNIPYSTIKYTKCKHNKRTENQQNLFCPKHPQKTSNINIEQFYRRIKWDNIRTWNTLLQYMLKVYIKFGMKNNGPTFNSLMNAPYTITPTKCNDKHEHILKNSNYLETY